MYALSPYRTQVIPNERSRDTVQKIKCALGIKSDPVLDYLVEDINMTRAMVPSFIKKIAETVTTWYIPYLVSEIRQAVYYEEALPAASLLAFSEKTECVDMLGMFLRSNRPLDVLVSIEGLSDLVAFGEPGPARNTAIFYLSTCRRSFAAKELEKAILFSPYGYPEEPLIPIPIQPYVLHSSSSWNCSQAFSR